MPVKPTYYEAMKATLVLSAFIRAFLGLNVLALKITKFFLSAILYTAFLSQLTRYNPKNHRQATENVINKILMSDNSNKCIRKRRSTPQVSDMYSS